MVQELLNRSDALWALVTNGRRLRLLRNSVRMSKPTYVEFDLEGMFEGNLYSEFALLYRLVHASRFPTDGTSAHESLLEQYYQQGIDEGGRVREKLREGVEKALRILGTAFLAHPDSADLRRRVEGGQLDASGYYRQLLRLVYRLLFLMVAEERRLIFPPDEADSPMREVYTRYYSVWRLRERAERYFAGDTYSDLWLGVKETFKLFRDDHRAKQLGLSALDGELFGPGACRDLEGAECANRPLLEAILGLSTFIEDVPGRGRRHASSRLRRRVNYADLNVEEFGSVYESLLDFHPQITFDPLAFDLVTGSERKQTGSYYTPPELVRELIGSALVPVVEERLKSAGQEREARINALLSLRICDPAAGSGHFLLAAARHIAVELARARCGEDEPPPPDYRQALRDVIRNCIYAVDKNPLAVDLCKVALWIEGHNAGLPLSFLDNHVKCGDSLVGVADLKVLQEGIPDEAYKPVTGDDKAVARQYRDRNRQEKKGVIQLPLGGAPELEGVPASLAEEFQALGDLAERTPDEVQAKEDLYESLRGRKTDWWKLKVACDLWTAAFFTPLVKEDALNLERVPTTGALRRHLETNSAHPALVGYTVEMSENHPFFHWPLEFPDVFENGGFDVVLGNPPWDTLSPDRKEFFGAYDRDVRFLKKVEQEELIEGLLANLAIRESWLSYERDLYVQVRFFKGSGRYRLFAPGNLGKGDFNIYRMFVETGMQITVHGGYVGLLVPSGFYNGANAMAIREELFERWQVCRVVGFLNSRKRWFPAIHAETRFCAFAARRGGTTAQILVRFAITSPNELDLALRQGLAEITTDFVRMQSPEVLAIPETRGQDDVAIATAMHGRWPTFGDEQAGEPVRRYNREVDMGNDRDLFGEDPTGLPVYEGRMVEQYDHRAKAYRSGRGRSAVWESLAFGAPGKSIIPQWYVPRRLAPSKLGDRVDRYRVGFCDVASPNAERSLVAALIPPGTICGDKVPTFVFEPEHEWAYMLWLAVANSFSMDYLLRKKVALKVSYSLLDSLPFPRVDVDHALVGRLVPLVLQMTCTSPEMIAYWNRLARYGLCESVDQSSPVPGLIDWADRQSTKAEIEAIVAAEVFGLTRGQLSSILDTFSVLERRERKQYGEYRTKCAVLGRYDQYC